MGPHEGTHAETGVRESWRLVKGTGSQEKGWESIKDTYSDEVSLPFLCQGNTKLSGGSLHPLVLPQMGSDLLVLRCPRTPDPDGSFPFSILYREEPQAGRERQLADGKARARSATLQGSHSVAAAAGHCEVHINKEAPREVRAALE